MPVNTAQQTGLLSSIKSLNPFGDSGHVRLPTTEGAGAPLPARNRREEEEAWFACESTFMPSPQLLHPFCLPDSPDMCTMRLLLLHIVRSALEKHQEANLYPHSK